MTKRAQFEVRAKFAIEMAQYVQIERCGYALRIVVSRIQDDGIFFQIDADQRSAARAQQRRPPHEECARLVNG